MTDDAFQLQKEWRELVLSELHELKQLNASLLKQINQIKMESVSLEEFKEIEKRLTTLEDTKTKILASWAVIQSLIILAAWLLTFLFKS